MRKNVLPLLPERLRCIVEQEVQREETLQEIHIRCGKKVALVVGGRKIVPEQRGQVVSKREFREVLEHISKYSMYAFEDEIIKGYITIPGGHRVGLVGKTIMEGGKIKNVRDIAFLNIRISHEKKGCADKVMPYLFEKEEFLSTLIVSPPAAGKTTLLRDIIRQLSNGGKYCGAKTVSVIDERSEIAGCYQGTPGMDVGEHCDVLDGCEKAEGIYMMLRSMAPEVIAVDEVGQKRDYEAMNVALTSGCKLLATVHGGSVQDLMEKNIFRQMIAENMFGRIVLLEGGGKPGRIKAIYNEKQGQLQNDMR